MIGVAAGLTEWDENFYRKLEIWRRLDETAAKAQSRKHLFNNATQCIDRIFSRLLAKKAPTADLRLDAQNAFNAAVEYIGRISHRVSACSNCVRATPISAFDQEGLGRETFVLESLSRHLPPGAAEACRSVIRQTKAYVVFRQAAHLAARRAEHYSVAFGTRSPEERNEEANAVFEYTQAKEIELWAFCKRVQKDLALAPHGK